MADFPRSGAFTASATGSGTASVALPAEAGVTWVITNIIAQLLTPPWTKAAYVPSGPSSAAITLAAIANGYHVLTDFHAKMNTVGGTGGLAVDTLVAVLFGAATELQTELVLSSAAAGQAFNDAADYTLRMPTPVNTDLTVEFTSITAGTSQELVIVGYDTGSLIPQIQVAPDASTFTNMGLFNQPGEDTFTYDGEIAGTAGVGPIVRFAFPAAPNQTQQLTVQARPN